MGVLEIVFGAVLLFLYIVIIAVVLLQQGRQAGISGAIAGGADSFLGKHKARDVDSMFERSTKYIAIAFFILTIVLDALIIFVK